MKIIKTILLFIALFFVSVITFSLIGGLLYVSILALPFFLLCFYFIILASFKSTKKYLKYALGVIGIYLALMILPFPRCNYRSYWTGVVEKCGCVGVLKFSSGMPTSETSDAQCIGWSYNHTSNK